MIRSAQYLLGLSIAVYPLRDRYCFVASLAGLSVKSNISRSNLLCFIVVLVVGCWLLVYVPETYFGNIVLWISTTIGLVGAITPISIKFYSIWR